MFLSDQRQAPAGIFVSTRRRRSGVPSGEESREVLTRWAYRRTLVSKDVRNRGELPETANSTAGADLALLDARARAGRQLETLGKFGSMEIRVSGDEDEFDV